MSLRVISADDVDGVAVVRIEPWRDCSEFRGVVATWRALHTNPAIRAVAVLSVTDEFSAAVAVDPGDLVTIAPKSLGLLKPFGVGLRGDVFDYGLQLVGDADAVIATSDARIAGTNVLRGTSLQAIWLRGSLPASEVNRLALLGLAGAMNAHRGVELGLIEEIVEPPELEEALVRRLLRFCA